MILCSKYLQLYCSMIVNGAGRDRDGSGRERDAGSHRDFRHEQDEPQDREHRDAGRPVQLSTAQQAMLDREKQLQEAVDGADAGDTAQTEDKAPADTGEDASMLLLRFSGSAFRCMQVIAGDVPACIAKLIIASH